MFDKNPIQIRHFAKYLKLTTYKVSHFYYLFPDFTLPHVKASLTRKDTADPEIPLTSDI